METWNPPSLEGNLLYAIWEPKVYQSRDYTIFDFLNETQGEAVELIEVKRSLNRLVTGQVIAGMDMFERQYKTNKVTPVVLCMNGDPALEWVCGKRNIKVQKMV